MVGIITKNILILDSKFICSNCHLIIQDPVQLVRCGHHLCRSCISNQDGSTIKCSDCSKETRRNELTIDQEFRHKMQSLPIECYFCNWTGVLNEYQNHIRDPHRNLKCNPCGEQFETMQNLNEHIVFQCQKATSGCILKEFGCKELIVRYNAKEHYNSDRHQEVLEKNLLQKRFLEDINKQSFTAMDTDLPQSPSVMISDPSTNRFQELFDAVQVLPNDERILSNGAQQSLNDTLLQCQQNYPIQNLDFFQTNLSVQETNMVSNENINDMPNTSTDGTLIWKISNFNEQMNDAQSERQTSIYSPPFYSSPTGYRMRARLYLHGDGNARRTHLSLFFVLMRGPNDSFLKFPFNYKVTFCLYDQTGAQRHIIKSFRPDIRSNSFQRPRSDINIASGIPKFVPLEMIQKKGNPYIRGETIYIKTTIDFIGIPNSLLPYALSLNPGIPTQRQQIMIQQEIARRAQ